MCGCGRRALAAVATVIVLGWEAAPSTGFFSHVPQTNTHLPTAWPGHGRGAKAGRGAWGGASRRVHKDVDATPVPGNEPGPDRDRRPDEAPRNDASLGGEPTLYSDEWLSQAQLDRMAKSLNRFIEGEVWKNPEMDEGMAGVMKSVGKACRDVAILVRRAQTDGIAGESGTGENVQGEVQKRLDVLSNSILAAGLCAVGNMESVASEEEEFPQSCAAVCSHEDFSGHYVAVFDPLDGSANIGAGLPCGTIFGILRRPHGASGARAILQPGNQLVAAGYCLYGASAVMVLTMGNGVHQFVLDEQRKEFVLSRRNLQVPARGEHYSFNEANSPGWDGRIVDYLNSLKNGEGQLGKRYECRYVGALIADVHRVIHKGGIFGYPADSKNPNGKLRLLYEGNPVAMVLEQAGGAATTGQERILDVLPQSTHHRVPAFFGSTEDIQELLSHTRRWG